MPAPKSIDAYKDCEEHFERALNSAKGIRVTVASDGIATQLAQKLNTYRERLRKNARKVYTDPNDPRHGASVYDKLQVIKDPENAAAVLIRPMTIKVEKVEEL